MENIKLIQQKQIIYQGKNTVMKKRLKEIVEKIKKWNENHTFLSSVLASIVASAILGVLGYFFAVKPVQDLGVNFKILNENIINSSTEMTSTITTLQSQVTELQNSNYNKQISDLQLDLDNQISEIQENFNNYKNEIDNKLDNIINSENNIIINNEIMVSPDLFESLQETYSTDIAVFDSSQKQQFDNSEKVLFINLKTNEMYTVKDLNEKSISLHYIDDNGDDIFFKGQYDEDGYWDGNCIVNRYRNGKLILIMDAEYSSGELISYKQVFSYKKTFLDLSYEVWAISEREPKNEKNDGFTWTYYKQEEYEQTFDTNSFSKTDILNVEDFKNCVTLLREGYYNGYTSNGYYNDDRGNAYLVKYNEYGYVRYLYMGKIVDGYPHDDTGLAWCISWGYDNANYYYYQGEFKDGKHIGIPKKISLEEINSIINNYNFDCVIKWIENM